MENKVKVWLARDKSGELFLSSERPNKKENYWGNEVQLAIFRLNSSLFPSVKWEDDEPTEAYITLAEQQEKKEIDWEQRRYEIAKDLLVKKYLEVSQFSLKREDDIRLVIGYADKIIKELKKQSE